MGLKCPFLSSIELKRVNCGMFGCRFDTVEFETSSACHEYTEAICFGRFLDCEHYRRHYTDPGTFDSCSFCCNSSGYTGLPAGYNGQDFCFCQKWKLPMPKDSTCDWNNRHPDWQFDEHPKGENELHMIKNIAISRLFPHKDNPRKDLGDLTELAESIKTKGILQNLTVVKRIDSITGEWIQGTYTVVIGHRRFAAAKKAGLSEVPCAIAEMTPQDQIATMLLENIQRSDLTIYEQAQGFQMMMDFGETVADISDKTGFSETTVRRRVKLLELDQEKLKKSVERGVTLYDLEKLNKITDLDRRNKVLDTVGTKNFDYTLKNALDDEKSEANKTLWIEALAKFAEPVTDSKGLQNIAYYYVNDDVNTLRVPEDVATVKYFYQVNSWHSISLYREAVINEAEQAIQNKYIKMKERADELSAVRERAFELRKDFIKSFNIKQKQMPFVIEFWVHVKLMKCNSFYRYDLDLFAEFMNLIDENGDYKDICFDDICESLQTSPERIFLLMAYCDSVDNGNEGYFEAGWHKWPKYKPNDLLDTIYEFLAKLGYEASDEEQSMINGTHTLLQGEEETQCPEQ